MGIIEYWELGVGVGALGGYRHWAKSAPVLRENAFTMDQIMTRNDPTSCNHLHMDVP